MARRRAPWRALPGFHQIRDVISGGVGQDRLRNPYRYCRISFRMGRKSQVYSCLRRGNGGKETLRDFRDRGTSGVIRHAPSPTTLWPNGRESTYREQSPGTVQGLGPYTAGWIVSVCPYSGWRAHLAVDGLPELGLSRTAQSSPAPAQLTESGLPKNGPPQPRGQRPNGRKGGLNKAAGAADAAVHMLRGDSAPGDKVRVTRRSCDPLTQNDAGGTPAS